MNEKMLKDIENYHASLSNKDKKELREEFNDDKPKGWLSIEEHLPMMRAIDIVSGGTKYKVRFEDGTEGVTIVADHNTWYYDAKENQITHWYNG